METYSFDVVMLTGLTCFTIGSAMGTYFMNRIVKIKDEHIEVLNAHLRLLKGKD